MVSNCQVVYVGISKELQKFKDRANWATGYKYKHDNEILILSSHNSQESAMAAKKELLLSNKERMALLTGFLGINHSQKSKRVISEKCRLLQKKIKEGKFEHKKITNTTIGKRYESTTEINSHLKSIFNKNIKISNIIECCNGKRKTAYGFTWEWTK
jgi:hypothetical protein